MKISIITATYNSADTIIDTLNSVQHQNYNNIEHIVIDGASNDKTLSLLNLKQNKISKFLSESDQGIYYAMNKGIALATGDIIGFLNSDDFYTSNNVLSKVIKVFNDNPELDACYADLIYVDKLDTNKTIRHWQSDKFKPGFFSKGWCPPHPTFFVKKSVYEKFGHFNTNYQIASDVELMMRFLEVKKINFSYIPELWVKMRTGGTTNKSVMNIIKQNIEIVNALRFHNLPYNMISFFLFKTINRTLQFFKK